MAKKEDEILDEVTNKEYEFGFTTDIEPDKILPGLDEEVIRMISEKKNEPEWLLDWRLESFAIWKEMTEPEWANINYKKPDFQDISYYSAPNKKPKYNSLDEVDPELLDTFKKLGISLDEQKKLALVSTVLKLDLHSFPDIFFFLLGPMTSFLAA